MRKKHFKGLKIFILFLLLIVILIFGFIFGREFMSHKKAQHQFEQLAKEIDDDSASGRNLAALMEKNKECIGWVCIKDTPIDYPVMHTPNEPTKYLNVNFEGQFSNSGVPFLDARCTIDSDNCIIYGHNMSSGLLFASLKNYADSSYCDKHPEIEFETENGDKFYKIFAVVSLKQDDDWYNFLDAPNRKKFKSSVAMIIEKALYCTEIKPKYGQQMVTLSTCYGSDKDGRLIVVAVNTDNN